MGCKRILPCFYECGDVSQLARDLRPSDSHISVKMPKWEARGAFSPTHLSWRKVSMPKPNCKRTVFSTICLVNALKMMEVFRPVKIRAEHISGREQKTHVEAKR